MAERLLRVAGDKGQGTRSIERIPGIELMEDLVAIAAKQHVPIGLIGGRGGVAVKALECLKAQYSRLEGWAEEGPQLGFQGQVLSIMENPLNTGYSNLTPTEGLDRYIEEIKRKIQDTKARIVFVGLGAPKQEFFIESIKASMLQSIKSDKSLKPGALTPDAPLVFMAVGGSFDEISGAVARAPAAVNNLGLKWAWRLIQEPWRWKRQLALVGFMELVVKEKLAPSK
jgi:N-acetylglucosaminyldiphosphoundecaprenol N-acetyl-beta-D-mannosaminyltransferase